MPARACIACSGVAIPGTSRCPNCTRSGWSRHKAKSQVNDLYSSPRWKELRARVLKEEPVCRVCGERASTEVDHVEPASKRPDLFFDRANVRGICEPCHKAKSSSEGGQAKRAKR